MTEDRQKLEEQLRTSLERCLLLEDQEKSFWLEHISQLPKEMLANVFEAVESKNQLMDTYTREALKNDPDHVLLQELDAKIREIKKGSLVLEEKSQTTVADSDLEAQLNDI